MTDGLVLTTRTHLVEVLVAHQRVNLRSCGCGWDFLGKSHAEHIADMVQEVDDDEPNR